MAFIDCFFHPKEISPKSSYYSKKSEKVMALFSKAAKGKLPTPGRLGIRSMSDLRSKMPKFD
jgi:hypothetical protein